MKPRLVLAAAFLSRDKMSDIVEHTSIVKNLFGLFQMLYFCLVLFTSHIDNPSQQFSAPFKAANSRQVQTCGIPFKDHRKKLQSQNWFIIV